eukprot:5714893-Amphidinium_carterae.3
MKLPHLSLCGSRQHALVCATKQRLLLLAVKTAAEQSSKAALSVLATEADCAQPFGTYWSPMLPVRPLLARCQET